MGHNSRDVGLRYICERTTIVTHQPPFAAWCLHTAYGSLTNPYPKSREDTRLDAGANELRGRLVHGEFERSIIYHEVSWHGPPMLRRISKHLSKPHHCIIPTHYLWRRRSEPSLPREHNGKGSDGCQQPSRLIQ